MTIPDIIADVESQLRKDAKVLPHKSNWASVLSDKCLRRLVYYRTDWDKQTLPEPYLQGIFNTGRQIEREVKNILNGIGMFAKPKWELIDTGIKLNDKFLNEHQIGGEPDVFLKVWPENGERPYIAGPIEIKGFNPNLFQQIQTIDSFRKYTWMKRYLGQLQMYELGSNFETGWFLIVNKTNWWDYKFIEMPLDYGFADTLIKRADAVNKHLADTTMPDKLNDPDECPKCPFAHICLPDYSTGGNLKVSDNEELETVLVRLKELENAAAEIKELEKQRDVLLTKGQDLICGNFVIMWKHIKAVRKPSPGGPYEQWRKKITYTGE